MEYKVNSWQELKKLTHETEFEIGDKIVFENCQVLVDEKPHTRVWQYVGDGYMDIVKEEENEKDTRL